MLGVVLGGRVVLLGGRGVVVALVAAVWSGCAGVASQNGPLHVSTGHDYYPCIYPFDPCRVYGS